MGWTGAALVSALRLASALELPGLGAGLMKALPGPGPGLMRGLPGPAASFVNALPEPAFLGRWGGLGRRWFRR